MISIIIPTFNEELAIGKLLVDLNKFSVDDIMYDVHMVDGDSTDGTVACALKLIDEGKLNYDLSVHQHAGTSRGEVLAYGTQQARGRIFLFLHSDCQLHKKALQEIVRIIDDEKYNAGGFLVRFIDPPNKLLYKGIEIFIRLRSHFFKMLHGDQGIFVCASDLISFGGFPKLPLMEDVALSQLFRRRGRMYVSSLPIYTSPRRIQANGFWRMLFLYFYLKTLFYGGADVNYLARIYNDLKKT